jgi:translation initiation factor 4B
LEKTSSVLAGRTIRVSVADPPKEREGGRPFGDRGDRDGQRGGFGGGPADEDRVWRREGPLPPLNEDRGERRGGGGSYDKPRGSRYGNGPPGGPSDEERGERMGFGSKFQASREPPPPSIAEETNDWRSNMKPPPTPSYQDKEKGGRFGGNERGGYGGSGGGRRGSGRNTPTGVGSPKLGPADLEEKWTIGSRFKPNTSTNVPSPERGGSSTGDGGPPPHAKKYGRNQQEDASDEVSDWRTAPRKAAPVPPSPGVQNNMARGASMERGPGKLQFVSRLFIQCLIMVLVGMSAPTPTRRKLDLLPRSSTNPTDSAGGLSSPKSTGEMTPVSATSVKPNPFGAAKYVSKTSSSPDTNTFA